MDIIIVSKKFAQARSFTITRAQLALLASLGLVAVVAIAVVLNYISLRYAIEMKSPMVQSLVADLQAQETRKSQSYVRESLATMSAKIGELQAQLMRLNSVGERLSKTAGVKTQEITPAKPDAPRGGAYVSVAPADLSFEEVQRQMDALSREIEAGADHFGALESVLSVANARSRLTPNGLPVTQNHYSSNFGWRSDPFNGTSAFHEGIDFPAPEGAPILAAAGGVVLASELHPQYGNMIEIDHGNGLITRYGHASKRVVKVGDVVLRGAKIGEVGSTGRSTGPHLHFEVRVQGVAQNPTKFLQPPG